MREPQEPTAEDIAERIRENIRARKQRLFSSSPAHLLSGSPLTTADLTVLDDTYNIYDVAFPTQRRIVGPVINLLKKVLRRLLTPVLARQVAYNLANASAARHLNDQLQLLGLRTDEIASDLHDRFETLTQRQATMGQEVLAALRENITQHYTQELQVMREHVREQSAALQQLREQIARAERKLRRLLAGALDGQTELPGPVEDSPDLDFDYFTFEERFRGSQHDLKERQRIYLEFFLGLQDVLDIGCGRGEFLELLGDAGIRARGIDIDQDMILACREKALNVDRLDAFEYLAGLPDGSLGGIFSAQVIEHLQPTRVVQLVRICHRKLRPGGPIVFETINPQCRAGMNAFYIDPLHVKPIHPDMLCFLFQSSGFHDASIRYVVCERTSAHFSSLAEDWSRENCPDYAAIARK